MIGNADLLNVSEKIAFLSSRKISAKAVMLCYAWAKEIRDKETCVISGFQSPLEQDVLKFLLRGKVSIILVLARSLWKRIPKILQEALGTGRLLIISPVKSPRVSEETALKRNLYIVQNCSSLVLGDLNPTGNLAQLLQKNSSISYRVLAHES